MVGRMNKGAAKALVSRLKLYLASPLYNPNNDLNKWQEAVDAAKAVIDLNVYDLHYTAEKAEGATADPTPGLLAHFWRQCCIYDSQQRNDYDEGSFWKYNVGVE